MQINRPKGPNILKRRCAKIPRKHLLETYPHPFHKARDVVERQERRMQGPLWHELREIMCGDKKISWMPK